MSIGRPDIPSTYEDYKSLAASTDQRYELIDGELYMPPVPTLTHQVVAKNIEFLLEQHVRATRCGLVLHAPLDVVLGEGSRRSVVQPDILFIANERVRIATEAEIVGAPDLVVEILFAGTAERDRGQKKTFMRAMACANTGSSTRSSGALRSSRWVRVASGRRFDISLASDWFPLQCRISKPHWPRCSGRLEHRPSRRDRARRPAYRVKAYRPNGACGPSDGRWAVGGQVDPLFPHP